MQEYVNQLSTMLATGEEELETEEELLAREEDADWDYDRFVDNNL